MIRLALIALIAGPIECAYAQSAQPTPPQDGQFISCSAFQRNGDGSWSPREQIQLPCGVGIGPSASFNPGAVMCGVDLAAELNKHCAF
jgi:hypothetical protein